jgi:hypothetical protein
MQKKKVVIITSGLAMLALLLVASPSLAATTTKAFGHGFMGRGAGFSANHIKPAVMGKISAISGSIITVAGRNNTTYTIDATSAKITSGFGTSTQTIAISNLTVGEMISVTGTVSGNNVTATAISVFTGTRNTGNIARTPRVMGKVTVVNGSSFTVQANRGFRGAKKTATTATAPAAVTYTVNTTGSTTFTKDGKAATLADVTTGEMVNVSGTPDASNNVAANSVNVVTKIAAPKNGAHTAPKTSTKTSLIGKFFNLFKGGKK